MKANTLFYYRQEHDHTCGAAAARMVMNPLLASDHSEDFYVQLLSTDPIVGTPRAAFEKLQTLSTQLDYQTGTHGTHSHLMRLHDNGFNVLVLFMLHTPTDAPIGHWAVLKNITAAHITLLDPWMGDNYTLAWDVFLARWHSDPALCNGIQDPQPWIAIRCAT